MPAIVVIFGRDRGDCFNIHPGDRITIGRSKLLSHKLNDPSISREHLAFVNPPHTNKCRVVDKQSRNGARINDKRLFHSQELVDGDVIQLGYTLLVYVQITFDAGTSITDFLEECEDMYASYLRKMRDHASRHTDRDNSDRIGSMSGTLNLASLFERKH